MEKLILYLQVHQLSEQGFKVAKIARKIGDLSGFLSKRFHSSALSEGWKVLFVSNQNARLCTFRLHNSVLLFCHTQDIQDSITICNSKTMYCNHLSNDHLGCLN
ncbi:hypothetical protein [Sporolactobacillus sp. THM19-2]|uniref:hypothetical protein n=1 Tax=Sporolactobacillus sp. THM19-2 TaxID=2511171 RepID=UPI0010219814|nr:hypothetical protein [Sporolactobacillus sp. THM19-2]RYL87080.1 hypothetical protein EWH91_13385 [Sporolactobacillus sp. THM19-2]